MKLTDQVCSLKLSKKLAKLGVIRSSVYKWAKHLTKKTYLLVYAPDGSNVFDLFPNNYRKKIYHTYTVAELGEMLPRKVKIHNTESCLVLDRDKKTWGVAYAPFPATFQEAKTEADARAKLLIYLLENKIISLDEVNET